MPDAVRQLGSRARTNAVLLAATLLTIGIAAPVLVAPGRRLFGAEIVGRHADPFVVIAQLDRPSAPGVYTQPLFDYPGAVLARVVGPVAACNLLVLSSFPLAALFAYLLARDLTRSNAAAVFAGMTYAFLPVHLAHAAYHPHVAQTQWLPLYLFALWRLQTRPGVRPGLMLFGAGALVALSSFYLAFVAALLTPVAVGGRALAFREEGRGRWRPVAAAAAVVITLGLCGIAYSRWAAAPLWSDPEAFGFPRQDLFRYSASPWALVVPGVDHPLLGSWARRFWVGRGAGPGLLEQQIGVGLGLLALAAVALVSWLRGQDRHAQPGSVVMLAALALAAFLCSLPPPFPSGALHAIAPMFRAYARFGVGVGLATAILAGIGFAHLLDRRRSVAFAALGLVAFELAPSPWRSRDVLPTPAHRWIASQPPLVHLLDMTVTRAGLDPAFQRLLGHEVSFRSPAVTDLDEPNIAGKLATFGYTHVLASAPGERASAFRSRRGLNAIRRFGDIDVLRVAAERPLVVVLEMGGFYDREYALGRSFRWMADRGVWWVANHGSAPRCASLIVEMDAFRSDRRLTLTLGPRQIGAANVSTGGPRRYQLGPFALAPGPNVLVFRPVGPPETPRAVSGSGDTRPLSVAVWDWAWMIGDDRAGGCRPPRSNGPE
ncbi:MAG: hypothetical protein ACRD1S_13750 [Vicinamibacterales bacterium]